MRAADARLPRATAAAAASAVSAASAAPAAAPAASPAPPDAPRGDSTEPRKPVSGRRGEDCGLTALAVCRHDSAGWQSRKGGRSWQLPFASASWYFPFAWCLRVESCGVGDVATTLATTTVATATVATATQQATAVSTTCAVVTSPICSTSQPVCGVDGGWCSRTGL